MEKNTETTKKSDGLINFAQMKQVEEKKYNGYLNYLTHLEHLQKTDRLKLKIIRGFGYIEYPCDVCGIARETGHVYNLALDLPEDFRVYGHKSKFVCSECSRKISPKDLETLEKLRDKVDASLVAEDELQKIVDSIPSLVAERKQAQIEYEKKHKDDLCF